MVLLIHKQQTNLWIKLPMIPPGLTGKIVKNRPLLEPIRLQDLEDSARSQAQKKINNNYSPKRRWLVVSVYRGRVSGEVNTHH